MILTQFPQSYSSLLTGLLFLPFLPTKKHLTGGVLTVMRSALLFTTAAKGRST
jgi:hypothetical protein